jgi:large subunit ribosomal protein L3
MGLELLGRKLGMTQIFNERGERIPVTVVRTGPCVVVQKKLGASDGYSAVQLGFEEKKPKHTPKPEQGHFARAGTAPQRFLFEVRMPEEEVAGLEVGQQIACGETFELGQKIDVIGTTKGRGFTGVIKRWGYKIHSQTHGTHEYFRHGGSMGPGTYPGRILPGKKMAGHYGSERQTTRNLRVEKIDPERNLLFIRGGVPGHTNAIVRIRSSVRASKG